MKISKDDFSDEDGEFHDGIRIADWKEHANEVLESIDDQLKEFGLEVVQYDTRADFYAWKIVPRTR